MAEQYVRWDPTLKIMSLRFSNVMLEEEYASFESWQDDPKARYWNWRVYAFSDWLAGELIPLCYASSWGYIDARDGAQAVAKALESNKTGHHQ